VSTSSRSSDQNPTARYLAHLPRAHQVLLADVNTPGLSQLRSILSDGHAVAFLGAGASAPLYPLWEELTSQLLDRASEHLSPETLRTCRIEAQGSPDAVVELLQRQLHPADYRETLRALFRQRRDPTSGQTWTPVQELVARCNFRGVITTNYDPGIINARLAVRPSVTLTGFASWIDDEALERWRSHDVFRGDEFPVLYAHGQHNQPGSIVLATSQYGQAYEGKLPQVLSSMFAEGHLVWVGFSFRDAQIRAILKQFAREQLRSVRHVALLPWDPGGPRQPQPSDPRALVALAAIELGARVVLYPAKPGSHHALELLLGELVDERFPPAPASTGWSTHVASMSPTALTVDYAQDDTLTVEWVHGGEAVEHFAGRAAELARLQRWAADEDARLIGVTAWGGAGKTALVTHWLDACQVQLVERGVKGLFAWSFYEEPSADAWAEALLAWMEANWDVQLGTGSYEARISRGLLAVNVVLVLDGLEIIQEGPAGKQFGRLLEGVVRAVIVGACQMSHGGLVVLTSRFPFADVEQFDGGATRILDVPSLTPPEGAELLQSAGAGWLSHSDRLELVSAVDGHALAVVALAGALTDHPSETDLAQLRRRLAEAPRTDTRVAKVLRFYADRLSPTDRQLVALVSLFQRPVSPEAILKVGLDPKVGAPLAGCDRLYIESAVRQKLTGLLQWHGAGSVSAHPLVRDSFRPLALTSASAHLASSVALEGVPSGAVTRRDDALRIVEMIELLLEADEWTAAHQLYEGRTQNGYVWLRLPAARLGQRCATAFVGTPERRETCSKELSAKTVDFLLNETALFGTLAGDAVSSEEFFRLRVESARRGRSVPNEVAALSSLAVALAMLGDSTRSLEAAQEALERVTTAARPPDIGAYAAAALAYDLAGATADAERYFIQADTIQLGAPGPRRHLYSFWGCGWARFMLRTGRLGPARQLTEANRKISLTQHRHQDVARCDHVLAVCDMHEGNLDGADAPLHRAVETFRAGDFVTEWTAALADLAEYERRCQNLSDAEDIAVVAAGAAAPRKLVPNHAAALLARARINEDLYTAGDASREHRSWDYAEHARRLATKVRRLSWSELDALELLARLEARALSDADPRPDGAGRAREAPRDTRVSREPLLHHEATRVRSELRPSGLDPDPLGTARRLALERSTQ
jgi:SIR2-like domain